MECAKCGRNVGDHKATAAFICTEIAADEYIYSYWRCASCGFYTLETYHDRFMGDAIITVDAPIEAREGDALVAVIKKCPEPNNKRCKCESHRSLFGGK